ncbi:potassium channel family protein [Marinomonas primoryensis]|jgi:voltage-gated potassium channel|uniref:Potassium channel family protein n=1 Tax=Marinomonas primoryensis TaxID=178399 RepID=A0A859D4D9_9GAMM|nr:potassium channel family protein [Marinomonas primoryensis]QKK82150.1 potassium channel family protein [Marinomonas primoryensis]|tara:strand:+ start:377 stop:1477 length:1101 start_codon:yes stop_codon:yes gene_type:complete
MNSLGLLLKRKNSRHKFRKKVHLHETSDIKKRFILLAGVIALHSLAMVFFEDLDWWQAFWLTMTSASTTGYGDISAVTFWGQFSTILLIYGLGITLLALIASDYVELRLMRKEMRIKGRIKWDDMQNHILIINTPKYDSERYLGLLISQISQTPELVDIPVQILTTAFPEGLPIELRSQGVVHHTGDALDDGMLTSAGVQKAKYIIVLCQDTQDSHCDSSTFDTLHRIQELAPTAFIMAEAINDSNRPRFKAAGAKAVIRPVRAYPEMLVRSLIAPGTEQVLEDLFRHQGDHTIRLNVRLKDVTWAQVVTTLIQKNIGTALGYVQKNGDIITHPQTYSIIEAEGLIILINDDQVIPSLEEIRQYFI